MRPRHKRPRAGRKGAEDVFRFTANTVLQELAKTVGGSATFTRHGGDE